MWLGTKEVCVILYLSMAAKKEMESNFVTNITFGSARMSLNLIMFKLSGKLHSFKMKNEVEIEKFSPEQVTRNRGISWW